MATYTTLATAKAAYLANSDYSDGAGDPAKAQAFRSACRALLILLPQSATTPGGASSSMSISSIEREIVKVEAWLEAYNNNALNVQYVSFEDYRE